MGWSDEQGTCVAECRNDAHAEHGDFDGPAHDESFLKQQLRVVGAQAQSTTPSVADDAGTGALRGSDSGASWEAQGCGEAQDMMALMMSWSRPSGTRRRWADADVYEPRLRSGHLADLGAVEPSPSATTPQSVPSTTSSMRG